MVSLTPEVEYPIEPFEWGLPALQICCFWLLHDQRYIDFQTGHFANIEQFKIYSHFTDFGQFKIDHSYFTKFGQDAKPRKTI